jgi:glycosyltransferase involved in cell wall biosynthesis
MVNNRPKISVCMAAFRGEKFIATQLRSILVQLSPDDEVIVVDDGSDDKTCEQVRSLWDRRVRLIERVANQGVAKTFEQALTRASGSVIFLSDQDDVWAPNKVATVLRAFADHPHVTLVATNASLIDHDGAPLGSSYYEWRGKFHSGFLSNLVRCKFLGCTMAFRSRLLPLVLPFPGNPDVLHDLWIGTVNSVTKGGTLYLDQQLVQYRRHPGSVTARKLSPAHRVQIRMHLLAAAAACWLTNLMAHR